MYHLLFYQQHPELEEKKPYQHLVYMSVHLHEAMQIWKVRPLPPEPSWSIRQVLVECMPPGITYVPTVVFSRDYPFVKHLARATTQAARCWTLGIPALPIL